MPRVSKKTKKAMERAEKEVRKQALKPKIKKKKKVKKVVSEPKSSTSKWIKDEEQGEVFFDGYYYWTTEILLTGEVISDSWTQEEWVERSKGKLAFSSEFGRKILVEEINDISRGSVERGADSRTIGHKQKSTKPSDKRGKSTDSKTRNKQSLSSGKSPKLVKGKGKNGQKVAQRTKRS